MNLSFLFFYFAPIQEPNKSKNARTCNSQKQNKKNDNNKASKNASHLFLSYMPLLSRGMSRGREEKQRKRGEKKVNVHKKGREKKK